MSGNICLSLEVFTLILIYVVSATIVILVMSGYLCYAKFFRCRDSFKYSIKNHKTESLSDKSDSTSSKAPTDINNTPVLNEELNLGPSDQIEEQVQYSQAYDEMRYPIALRNGYTKINERSIRDTDYTYAMFVTLPKGMKKKNLNISTYFVKGHPQIETKYGSQDHLRFLNESSDTNSNERESTYLKARRFLPNDNCPQNLRLLIMEMEKPRPPPKQNIFRCNSEGAIL